MEDEVGREGASRRRGTTNLCTTSDRDGLDCSEDLLPSGHQSSPIAPMREQAARRSGMKTSRIRVWATTAMVAGVAVMALGTSAIAQSPAESAGGAPVSIDWWHITTGDP